MLALRIPVSELKLNDLIVVHTGEKICADGVIVEVHNDPIHALCDGAQSLTCEQFAEVAKKVRAVREAVTR